MLFIFYVLLLFENLISSSLKQAAVGQSVVQAARPQGSLMPLLFGIGVELILFRNRLQCILSYT